MSDNLNDQDTAEQIAAAKAALENPELHAELVAELGESEVQNATNAFKSQTTRFLTLTTIAATILATQACRKDVYVTTGPTGPTKSKPDTVYVPVDTTGHGTGGTTTPTGGDGGIGTGTGTVTTPPANPTLTDADKAALTPKTNQFLHYWGYDAPTLDALKFASTAAASRPTVSVRLSYVNAANYPHGKAALNLFGITSNDPTNPTYNADHHQDPSTTPYTNYAGSLSGNFIPGATLTGNDQIPDFNDATNHKAMVDYALSAANAFGRGVEIIGGDAVVTQIEKALGNTPAAKVQVDALVSIMTEIAVKSPANHPMLITGANTSNILSEGGTAQNPVSLMNLLAKAGLRNYCIIAPVEAGIGMNAQVGPFEAKVFNLTTAPNTVATKLNLVFVGVGPQDQTTINKFGQQLAADGAAEFAATKGIRTVDNIAIESQPDNNFLTNPISPNASYNNTPITFAMVKQSIDYAHAQQISNEVQASKALQDNLIKSLSETNPAMSAAQQSHLLNVVPKNQVQEVQPGAAKRMSMPNETTHGIPRN